MVGVPGRSKGCNTCRKRRVKCDERKPFCFRCAKAGFECLGYERQRLWRHTSTAPFPMAEEQGSTEHDIRRESEVALRPSPPQVISPPAELSFVAFQGDFHYAFLFTNFVWKAYGSPWLEQAAEGKLGDLAFDATKALAQANFGRANKQPDLSVQGALLYGQCLRKLAGELGKGSALEDRGKTLLVPVLVLLMHAAAHADRTGAISHMKGVARLLQMCGPEAFQQSPWINAFEAARSTLLIVFLVSRQRLFLEDLRWQTIPWALDPASKTAESKLLDIMVTIPGILQDHADAESSPDQDPGLYAAVMDRLQAQLIALYRWRWCWQAEHGGEVSVDGRTWQPTGKAADVLGSIGPPRQLDRLHFARLEAATEIMIYNAALMWLLALCWKLAPLTGGALIEACAQAAAPAGALVAFEPLRRPGAAVTVRDPAMEICRAFEWLARNHGRSCEQTCLYMFPVGMAMSVLEKEDEGRAWVGRLLESSPITSNYIRGENVAGFGFYLTLKALDTEASAGESVQTVGRMMAVY